MNRDDNNRIWVAESGTGNRDGAVSVVWIDGSKARFMEGLPSIFVPAEGFAAGTNGVTIDSDGSLLVVQGGRLPTTVDFDDLGDGVEVTDQYPGVKFASEPGFTNWTTSQDFGSSLPNIICTGPDEGGVDCEHDTVLEFDDPVSRLRFVGVGINDTGKVAEVNVFVRKSYAGTVDVVGTGDADTPVEVDLTAFHDVTRIHITNITDYHGIGWDDFSFNSATVPGSILKMDTSGFAKGDAPFGFEDADEVWNIQDFVLGLGFSNSNPYRICEGPGGDYYIVDSGANAIVRRERSTGVLSLFATFPGIPNPTNIGPPVIDAVPTGILYSGGQLQVSTLTGFPFLDDLASIYEVDAAGNVSMLRDGLTLVTDISLDPRDGRTITGEFGTFSPDSGFARHSGRCEKLMLNGRLQSIRRNLDMVAGIAVGPEGDVYASNLVAGTISRIRHDSGVDPFQFNCFMSKKVEHRDGAIGGRVASGGEGWFKRHRMGDDLTPSGGTRDDLIVKGALFYQEGMVYSGNALHSSDVVLDRVSFLDGSPREGSPPFSFSDAAAEMRRLADALESLPPTDTAQFQFGQLILVGGNPDLNVFSVDGPSTFEAGLNSVRIRVPPGATVVVNVRNSEDISMSVSGMLLGDGADNTRLLWNFYGVKNLNLTSVLVEGSVLIPQGCIHMHSSELRGTVIGRRFHADTSDVHRYPFVGNLGF